MEEALDLEATVLRAPSVVPRREPRGSLASAEPVAGDAPPSWSSGCLQAIGWGIAATALVAWPVLRSPRTLIFGHEIVGRHYDPFLVIQQFAQGGARGVFRQPLTDDLGALLSRLMNPIGAYNLVVLSSFPLAVLSAYALGRYLTRAHRPALVGAMAFAFAPTHLAHATYHLHVAQVQWIPLYLLALFVATDYPTVRNIVLLVAAAAAVALANFYAGLIVAVITPIAAVAYWLGQPQRRRDWRGVVTPTGVLAVAVLLALPAVAWMAPSLVAQLQRVQTPTEDLSRYGARWQAYFLPPVDHPLLGHVVRQIWDRLGVGAGLLEQQLSLEWGLLLLAGVIVWRTLRGRHQHVVARHVPALLAIGLWGFMVSLAPGSSAANSEGPNAAMLLHALVPAFRAYARFGVVVSLSVALLAGIAVDRLLSESRSSGGRERFVKRAVVAGLLGLALFESSPVQWRARDVLPTRAHRWLASRQGVSVLDCTSAGVGDTVMPFLMGKTRIGFMAPPFEGCGDPLLSDKMTALGYTHLLWNGESPVAPAINRPPASLTLERAFDGARVYATDAAAPVITVDIQGFNPWERAGDDVWRWMQQSGGWTVRNRWNVPIHVILDVDLNAAGPPRTLILTSNDDEAGRIQVDAERHAYSIGPLLLQPGDNYLSFRSLEAAVRPNDLILNGDRRAVTVMFRPWRWTVSS